MRKSQYALVRKLLTDEEASALSFGSSMHKGLEHWYTLPLEERQLDSKLNETAEMYAYGHDLEKPTTGALESIRQFVTCRYENLKTLGHDDKRSLVNGVKILKAYFKLYHNDGWFVLRDKDGAPYIEKDFSFVMYEDDQMVIRYFGRIDVILHNPGTSLIAVTDHKTTHALGQEFYNRCKPNPQYTGYVLGAREALGIDTKLFMINGIQVAKTKHEFARQITDRNEEDFQELRSAVLEAVLRFKRALSVDEWPMTSPDPCAAYGGCQYRKICEVPSSLKESVINATWGS